MVKQVKNKILLQEQFQFLHTKIMECLDVNIYLYALLKYINVLLLYHLRLSLRKYLYVILTV